MANVDSLAGASSNVGVATSTVSVHVGSDGSAVGWNCATDLKARVSASSESGRASFLDNYKVVDAV